MARRFSRARDRELFRSARASAGRALKETVFETFWAPPRWMSRRTYLGPRPPSRQAPIGLRVRFAFRRPFIRPAVQFRAQWRTGTRFTPVRKSLEAVYGKKQPVMFEAELPFEFPELKARVSTCSARSARRSAVFVAGAGGVKGRQWKNMMRGAKRNVESEFHCGGA